MRTFIVCLILLSSSIASSNHRNLLDQWSGYALILASPKAVRLARISDVPQSASLVIGQWFNVKLARIKPIHGDFGGNTLEVTLHASQAESLSTQKTIFVLLKLTEKEPQAIYWGVPYSIACLPPRLILGEKFEKDFSWYKGFGQTELCTNTQWFQ